VIPYLGGLVAQQGRFSEARELVAEADRIYEELGAHATATIHCGTVRADVELLEGDWAAAERTLREQCTFLEQTGDRSHLGVRAAKLAEALLRGERIDDAEEWLTVSRTNAAPDDQSAQIVLQSVAARLLARRGLAAEARAAAEETVRLADGTDGLNRSADARLALAEVLRAQGLAGEADRAIDEAVAIFERKGNVAGASRARALEGIEVRARPGGPDGPLGL
jgi:tetratricopeptide (TPR) repeat protein